MDFIMTISGAEESPCPTFCDVVPSPFHFTILNPESLLALTWLVIVPSLLVTAAPPAFHFHET